MTENFKTNTIPTAIEAIKKGEIVIVVDDAQRENEGDFIAAAEKITHKIINFMATYGKGLICVPLTKKRCKQLKLHPMVYKNTDPLETAFTISVDAKKKDISTGISALDRTKTIQTILNEKTQPKDLTRPGHIFPLIAKDGGVLRRTGHTEAAIDLARLAGLKPAGVIVEIMNKDGTMARMPQLITIAKKFNLKIITIEDLIAYRMQYDSLIIKKQQTPIKTKFGNFTLHAYQQTTNNQIHIALTKGTWTTNDKILTKIYSNQPNKNLTDIFTQKTEEYLTKPFQIIEKEKKGALIFINPKQNPQNLLRWIEQIKELQNKGNFNTTPTISMDDRDFGIGAQILHHLGIYQLQLISNSTHTSKIGISGYGIKIIEMVKY